MENKFMKFFNENRWFIVFFIIWLFIHIVLLMNGSDYNDFWPFDGFDTRDYGTIEFFVYVALPLLIFVVYKLVGKDIKKAMDE